MLHRMWRWLADIVIPDVSYTSHLHAERGSHALWHAEHSGEPLEPFDP